MANSINGKPWVLDTASATAIKTGKTWVVGVTFRNYTTSTDTATIQDGIRGVTVFELKGNTLLSPIEIFFPEPQWINNFTLTQLSSGQVEVYLK